MYAYDDRVLIDLSGGIGVSDACSGIIRIPVEKSKWNRWENKRKIFRFWKLIERGFQSANQEEKDFITEKAFEYLKTERFVPWPSCRYLDSDTEICEKPHRRSIRSHLYFRTLLHYYFRIRHSLNSLGYFDFSAAASPGSCYREVACRNVPTCGQVKQPLRTPLNSIDFCYEYCSSKKYPVFGKTFYQIRLYSTFQ